MRNGTAYMTDNQKHEAVPRRHDMADRAQEIPSPGSSSVSARRGRYLRKLIMASLLCAVAGVGFVATLNYGNARDFDPIVYASRDGLCSVGPISDAPPYCPGVFLQHPKYSPDGKLIVAVREIGGGTEVVVTNRRGDIVRSLIGSRDFIRPVWSPDGKHIWAISYDAGGLVGRWHWSSAQKEVVAIDGRRIDCGIDRRPDSDRPARSQIQSISFSPTGRKVALLCGFESIYVAPRNRQDSNNARAATPALLCEYAGVAIR